MEDAPTYRFKPLYNDETLEPEPNDDEGSGFKRQLPIRLLRLFHGKFDDDIRVELEEAWLDEIEAQGADGTSFKALSYVWGSRDNPATIWIGEETISVTQNLAAALRHLRDEHDDGVYWIDAICIDQSSPSERSKQVALMRDVFRVAGEVIFWLGPEENDSDHAMDLIHSFGEKVRYDIRSDALIPIDKPGDEAKWLSPLEPVRYGDREADALADLLMRPWFERLWVRQEAFHGRKSGVVMCGTRRMSWSRFRNWVRSMIAPGWDFFPQRRDWWLGDPSPNMRLFDITYLSIGRTSLVTLRMDFGATKCEDPRDRIYATLSMLPPEERQLGISANYTLSQTEVYKDAVTRYLSGLKDATVLTECESRSQRSSDSPSWVPDWSYNDAHGPCSYSEGVFCVRASSRISSCITIQDNLLSTAAVVIDTIETVQEVKLCDSNTELIEWTIRKAIPQDAATTPYAAGRGSLLHAYVRAFTWGDLSEAYTPFPDNSSGELETLTRVIGLVHQGEPYHEAKRTWTHNPNSCKMSSHIKGQHAPFTTQKGYVGVGPIDAQPGDAVCVILGCQRPLVLRHVSRDSQPLESTKPQYRIVGQCYLSGFMHGEALLGQLPHPWKTAIDRWNSKGGNANGELTFANTETGDTQLEDPRLSTLGIDLEPYRQGWESGIPELVDVPIDVLREKGVDVQMVDIV